MQNNLSSLLDFVFQEIKSDDIKKYLQQSKENRVSKREFKAVNAKLENLEEAVMKERSALRPIVLEMIEEVSSKWDQQFLDMAKNNQETYSSVMQLVTLDLAHEVCYLNLSSLGFPFEESLVYRGLIPP